MKCSEILPPFTCYRVFVRLKAGMSGSTLVFAENVAFARDLAFALYGPRNVVSVVVNEEADQTNESTGPQKPPDPDRQRIRALDTQKKQLNQQLKTARAQRQLKQAQTAMQKARPTPRPQ
jgi:hypothetical protein